MINPRKVERLLNSPIQFDIDTALKRGWELFKAQPLILIAYFLIVAIVQFGATYFLEDFSSIVSILVAPPLTAGFYLVANKISRNERVEFQDCFDGFKFWLPVVSVNIISGIITVLGVIALIIPGIYLGVAYAFAMPFVLFAGTEFWTSMELSRKLITKVWWRFFAFVLLLVVINIIGLLFLGVGFLVSGPFSYMAVYAAFEELTGDLLIEDEPENSLPTSQF
ncbi:hypothetical protein [Algoriphagus zhangzhouensis]|uniref:Uncharacterized protein n=1 Tax=Algoriphagus zhangzhouensis TaxID=1073327 RepID=A0A1M7ZK81_9BACT|nr:hypothetical protein [Algoriphagus zhangzhouensis]TDY43176.1 hypothetical protein A8938_3991 [Algoriphagus zhangzhouensis]SHO65320.1 hypothetical protein SAMN04488108_3985 [Algoriphagus zhangzhouensis]